MKIKLKTKKINNSIGNRIFIWETVAFLKQNIFISFILI
jgi:hypothetical protein